MKKKKEFIVESALIAPVLKRMSWMIAGTGLSVKRCVRFTAKEGFLEMTVLTEDIDAFECIDCVVKSDEPISFLVNNKQMLDSIASMTGNITFEIDEAINDRVIVKCKKSKLTLPCSDAKKVDKDIRKLDNPKSLKINRDALGSFISDVQSDLLTPDGFVADHLCSISIQVNDKKTARLFATNTKAIFIEDIETESDADAPFIMQLNNSHIKAFMQYIKLSGEMAEVFLCEKFMAIKGGSFYATFSNMVAKTDSGFRVTESQLAAAVVGSFITSKSNILECYKTLNPFLTIEKDIVPLITIESAEDNSANVLWNSTFDGYAFKNSIKSISESTFSFKVPAKTLNMINKFFTEDDVLIKLNERACIVGTESSTRKIISSLYN